MQGCEPGKNDRTDVSSLGSKTCSCDRPIALALDVHSPPRSGEEGVIVELDLDPGKTEGSRQGTFGLFNFFFQTGQSSCFGFGNCIPNRCCVTLTSAVRKMLRRQRFHDKASQTGTVPTDVSNDRSDNIPVEEEEAVGGASTLKRRSFLPLSPSPSSSPPPPVFPEPEHGRNPPRNCGSRTRQGEQLGTTFDQDGKLPEKETGSKVRLPCPVGNRVSSYVDCGFEIVDFPVRPVR
jgi:hypothetical protein